MIAEKIEASFTLRPQYNKTVWEGNNYGHINSGTKIPPTSIFNSCFGVRDNFSSSFYVFCEKKYLNNYHARKNTDHRSGRKIFWTPEVLTLLVNRSRIY